MAMTRREALLGTVGIGVLGLAGAPAVHAQDAAERVRKIVLYTDPQGSSPQAFQAAQLTAQAWRQLGLEVEVRAIPRQQQTQIVWFERQRWDVTTWRMVGRPERSDPDELLFNLFHSSTAERGFNFVGYSNPDYDRLVERQRTVVNQDERRRLVAELQQMISRDQPYGFLVHPKNINAFNNTVWRADSMVTQAGIGIRNFWTFVGATPVGAQKTMILNARFPMIALHPLYISGATDSWVTDLIWDRLARVGPDGLPRPWAAERIEQVSPTVIDCTIRQGMMWHDGRPVTLDDVVYSFEAPAMGDKVPMYRPFVADIDKVEKKDERTVRFTLKQANASFITSSLAKINLIPKHVWEPVMREYMNRPETIERVQDPSPVGSGPFKLARARLTEEIVLDAVPQHWSGPKMDRWIMRIVLNPEATIGMLRRGEINFLADYGGDPEVLVNLAREVPAIQVTQETDIGFEFVAFNNRRAPFNDPRFRNALSAALDRNVMVQAAWGGFAVAASSHVSPALEFWHDPSVGRMQTGVARARQLLQEAGYRVVANRLYYPAGTRESLPPGE